MNYRENYEKWLKDFAADTCKAAMSVIAEDDIGIIIETRIYKTITGNSKAGYACGAVRTDTERIVDGSCTFKTNLVSSQFDGACHSTRVRIILHAGSHFCLGR